MISMALKSRERLVKDIQCLESELSHLRGRFDVIVKWIRSEYNELVGLPDYVIIAVRGDRELTDDMDDCTPTNYVKVEYDHLDDSSNLDGIDTDNRINNSSVNVDGDILKDIEAGPVSRLRYQLQQRKLACREVSQNENANVSYSSATPGNPSFPLLFEGDGNLQWENDRLVGDNSTDDNKTEANADSSSTFGDWNENESKQKQQEPPNKVRNKRVKKTAKHLQANRDKGLILDAFEYKKLIASLPKGRLNCAICSKIFATSTQLRRHEFEVHLTKDEQNKLRNRRSTMYTSEEMKNAVPTLCDICNKPFKNIESHKINHLPPEVMTTVEGSRHPHYRCLKCESVFSEKKKYLTHITRDCKAEEILENSNYAQHTEKLRKERNFLCNQCGQAFNRKHTLKIHVIAVHAKKKDFKCQYCDKAFAIEFVKKNHERKHLGTSSVACELCGFTFTCKQILKNHIRGVHENRRPFQCQLCDKSFKTSHARDYHVNTHGNPNGRKRGLNREVDPIKAAAKRRQSTAWQKNRVQKLTQSTTADNENATDEMV